MGEDNTHGGAEADAARLGEQVFATLAGPGDRAPWEVLGDFAPALGEHIRHGLGSLVARPGLDLRTRELVTVALLAALGDCEPQLAFHTAGALRAGASAEQIVETLMQVSIYAGVPRTLNAIAVARKSLADAAVPA